MLMNGHKKTVESRFLLGAIVCAVLLIVNYFALVGTPWGHQLDGEAFLGSKTLGRNIITLESDILNLVRKRTLFLAAVSRSLSRLCAAVPLLVSSR
jgi:hypothetical protein